MQTIFLILNRKRKAIAIAANADIAMGLIEALPDAIGWKKFPMYVDEAEIPTFSDTKPKVVYMKRKEPEKHTFPIRHNSLNVVK